MSELTGYPSIDKPWLKYYSEEAINAPLPTCKYVDYVRDLNKDGLDDNAVEFHGKQTSYREMFENIDRVASGLESVGITSGDIVPVFSVNTPETLYTVFALNLIGAIPCLEYVTESEKEAVEAIEKCNAQVVIVFEPLLKKFRALSNYVEQIVTLPLTINLPFPQKIVYTISRKKNRLANEISYSKVVELGKTHSFTKEPYRKDSTAIIVHSGGTTGVPKGVELSNESINYIAWSFHNDNNGAKRGERHFTSIPLFHAFGFCMGVIVPLSSGLNLSLDIKYDEESFINNFLRIKPSHTMSSSTYIPALISDSAIRQMDLSFYKTMGIGGTPITHTQEEAFSEFMHQHNSAAKPNLGYGMSEAASAACTERNRYYGKTGSAGIPLCKTIIKAVDIETGKELPYGEEGELYINTPGRMLRYFQNEKETAATITTDDKGELWIKTGDLGFVDEDGFVFITGKLKRIYTTRTNAKGTIFHIFPDYIAAIVGEAPSVRECAVICIPHQILKSIPIAFVVSTSPSEDSLKGVREYCEERLPEHSCPKAYYPIEAIPKTPIGKPDYQQLEELASERYGKAQ